MKTTANLKSIVVHWTESEAETRENVVMSPREFRGLLAEIRDEWARDGSAGYCKVKFSALFDDDETATLRIDVDASSASTDLEAFLVAVQS